MPREIDVRQLQQIQLQQSVHLVDVREQWEHEAAALPDSQLIPLDQLSRRASEIPNDDDTLLVVYCHHGIRSQSAAMLLEHLGLRNVVSLVGGIDAYSLFIDPTIPRY